MNEIEKGQNDLIWSSQSCEAYKRGVLKSLEAQWEKNAWCFMEHKAGASDPASVGMLRPMLGKVNRIYWPIWGEEKEKEEPQPL